MNANHNHGTHGTEGTMKLDRRYMVYRDGIAVASFDTVRDASHHGSMLVLGGERAPVLLVDWKGNRKSRCPLYPPSVVSWTRN